MNTERTYIVEKTKDEIVDAPDGSIENTLTKLITHQRVHDERLEWLRPINDGDNLTYGPIESDSCLYGGRGKIVDADGVVYDGILLEDGTVDEGWFVYDCPETFERSSEQLNSTWSTGPRSG